MSEVVIYTMPNCVQCNATKKYCDDKNIEYTTVDISTDPSAYNLVSSLGYKQAPVVIAGDSHWSGFRLDMLATLH